MSIKEEQTNNVSRLLGQKVEYPTTYDKTILVREERATNRKHLNIEENNLPFVGFDTWNAYEFTCLLNSGIPVAGILKLCYDCNSKYIVESKSLKLYLNSFNFYKCGDTIHETFVNAVNIIKHDLSELLETEVSVNIELILNYSHSVAGWDSGTDDTSVQYPDPDKALNNPIVWLSLNLWDKGTVFTGDVYNENPDLLKLSDNQPAKTPQAYWSNTLFSRCKVTKQPDHGDIYIYYDGDERIDTSSLLQYITSLRNECHFHEEICETVYRRLYDLLGAPTDLAVACLFARRGGIDINPVRASNKTLLNMLFGDLQNVNKLHAKSMKQ